MNEWLFRLIEKVDEFESPEDWYNFDVETWMLENGANPQEQVRVIRHYYDFIERMKKEHKNSFDEDLFKI